MALADFFEEQDSPPDKTPTPSLAEMLSNSQKAGLYDTRVCMPGVVVKYDYKKQSVDVEPALKQTYSDGKVEEMATIFNVPVAFPRAGKSFMSFPIKKGDTVMLVFADRSIDKWKSTGGKVDPADKRMHDLSDAYAIPGGYSFKEPAEIDNEKDVIIKNEDMEFRLSDDGKLQMRNENQEFVELMNRYLRIVREAVVYTGEGPQKLKHSEFAQLATDLKTFLKT